MKNCAAASPLPFVVEDSLAALGQRISLVRRARGLTQADLAAKAGIGLNSMVSIEKGTATVQIGFVFKVLWALGLEHTFKSIEEFGADRELALLMASSLPETVMNRKSSS